MPKDMMKDRRPAGTIGGLIGGAALGAGAMYYMSKGKRKSKAAPENPQNVKTTEKKPKAVKKPKSKAVTKKTTPVQKESKESKGAGGNIRKNFPVANDKRFKDQSPGAIDRRKSVSKVIFDHADAYDKYKEGSRERKFIGNKVKKALEGIQKKHHTPGSGIWEYGDDYKRR